MDEHTILYGLKTHKITREKDGTTSNSTMVHVIQNCIYDLSYLFTLSNLNPESWKPRSRNRSRKPAAGNFQSSKALHPALTFNLLDTGQTCVALLSDGLLLSITMSPVYQVSSEKDRTIR
jgi:hypothetical protein